MKFEKLDNDTLRCTLTQEDLVQNGVELDDLFSNTQNAREFLEKIIRMAEMEVGFRTNGNMMSIQAAIMSENEIVLTFSENQVSSKDIIEHLRNMFSGTKGGERTPPAFDAKEEILREIGKNVKDGNLAEGVEKPKVTDTGKKQDKSEEFMETEQAEYEYLLGFPTLQSVIDFSRILPKNENALSRLFYLSKSRTYYLEVNLNDTSRKYVYEFVAAAMEFSRELEKDSIRSNYLEEHAKVICAGDALEILASLA